MSENEKKEGWYWPSNISTRTNIRRGAHALHYAEESQYSLCREWRHEGEPFRSDMAKIPPPLEPGKRCRKCLKKLVKRDKADG